MADVIPTRMELIKTKGRIKLAKKGHELLKKKRDALVAEFFDILKKVQDLRGELTESVEDAYYSLKLAELYHTRSELDEISLSLTRKIDIDLNVKNIMGVKIPSMEMDVDMRHFYERSGYSPLESSAKLDSAISAFERVFEITMKLAETETAIKRLIGEIEKTKRRVSSLEHILIPRLEAQKKMITLRLDEMERDSFVSLKVIKKKLDKKKEESAVN